MPAGSSLANLTAGEYTVQQIMEAGPLVPSGNDAAYALAYYISKNKFGEGYTATEYINYFMAELGEYLIEEGYSKTNLYNDPSGASMQADTDFLDYINRVALKLLEYDFIRECIGKKALFPFKRRKANLRGKIQMNFWIRIHHTIMQMLKE